MHSLPLTKEDKKEELLAIKQMALNNGFPTQTNDSLNKNILLKISTPWATQNNNEHKK
jgi:hypothetical protein